MLDIAPVKVEAVYTVSRKQDLIQSIFEFISSKDETCLNDIFAVELPEQICPFGCKKTGCIYNYDVTRCPHNLDEKSLDELYEYMLKIYYHKSDNDDGNNESMIKKVPKDLLEAVQKYSTLGNYDRNR